MKGFTAVATLALAGSAVAAPAKLVPRQNINANGTQAYGVADVDILQFALSLEYLEINLYETVVTTFDGNAFESAGFSRADRATFKQIIAQEKAHIGALRRDVYQLGGTPVKPCKYNYGKIESLNQLLNNTDAVNGLGPSAYLGAGPYLSSKLLLTEGGALGNIETRHNSWLNGLIGRSEQPIAFQLPLSPTQSYGVASQFIVEGSCPSGPPKAVTAFPPSLTITNKGWPAAPLNAGDIVYVKPGKPVDAPRAAFLYGFNTTIVDFDSSSSSAQIPLDFAGQGYIVLTNAVQGQELNNDNSLTVPQALYVDKPAWDYANDEVSTYDFD
ncbi:hypothetical protein P389DRAFT_198175 [Cystobasidium minutum MCA 4210]|uniref:uncharacterized protein n=1 Tax=Cystobasidium minutum MCA 4210 TaxID=1397322 RepID=UPI0034CE4AF4|eukprot:jgi/Rhomi1/198175/gm1.6389_g